MAREVTDDEILHLVEAWIDDLARGDSQSAFDRTRHDPHFEWTPALIEAVINGYGLPEPHPSGTRYTVTIRTSALGAPRHEIDRSDAQAPVLAYVRYDLPLNGEWSDLTATFRVEDVDGSVDLVLEEIHVF
jgi:hypothetical protein